MKETWLSSSFRTTRAKVEGLNFHIFFMFMSFMFYLLKSVKCVFTEFYYTLPLTKIASKRDCVSCHESSLILIQPPSGLYPAFLDQFWEIRSQHYAQRNINNGTPMTKITSFLKKHFRNKVAIKERQIGRGDIIANLGSSFVWKKQKQKQTNKQMYLQNSLIISCYSSEKTSKESSTKLWTLVKNDSSAYTYKRHFK